jgi:16S rRNA (cytidine1402-2'-O)-methyltransferase
MPSTSNTAEPARPDRAGVLYVVATPIGHLDDITLRALSVLRSVDLVAAEDTRTTGRLLSHHGIAARLVSYHEHNEESRAAELLRRLREGASIALTSEAGTPGISDPGYRLVSAAAAAGIRVVPVPGAMAAAAALSAAGLPTDSFVFAGFLSKKPGRRLEQIKALASEPRTVVFYESPQRIVALIEALLPVFGDRPGAVARELTKVYEEFIRGPLSAILEDLRGRPEVKGECILLVAGRKQPETSAWEALRADIRLAIALQGRGLSELARVLALKHGLPRREVYAEAMKMRTTPATPADGL